MTIGGVIFALPARPTPGKARARDRRPSYNPTTRGNVNVGLSLRDLAAAGTRDWAR